MSSNNELYIVCPDVIMRCLDGGEWIASNPRVHRHVQISSADMTVLTQLAAGRTLQEWEQALSAATLRPRSTFTNAGGLLADPSGLAETAGEPVRGSEAMKVLRSSWILCRADRTDYEEFLGLQTSLLDSKHLGTFHQNVGRHLLLDLRLKETWRWWHDQKFAPDGLSVRPNAYEWMQRYFFDSYFAGVNLQQKRLLDFACGNGFYSRRFHDFGADVVGVDTSSELIEIATKNHGDHIQFLRPADGSASDALLDAMPAKSFDVIYISDALLFFFHDPKSGAAIDVPALDLLKRLRRVLADDGTLYLMEPNGTFWLTSHAGQPPKPTAVVTEYRNRVYHVAPTPDRVISALGRSGFAVTDLIHPPVDPQATPLDTEMYTYGAEFPLWDFYVCKAR